MKKLFDIWLREFTHVFKDEGLLMFLVVVPFAYPIVYSWVYNNETVREVPVVVVDRDNSAESREFTRLYDASPDVNVVCRAGSLAEARNVVAHNDAYGVLYFPEDYSERLNRMEHATVSVYCDMTFMMAYKNVLQTAMAVSGNLGAKIQTKILGNSTEQEDRVATKPLEFEEVPIFNVTGGYGNFILPGVLVLIIQQTILLACGMTSGTRRERYGRLTPPLPIYDNPLLTVIAKAMAYFLVTSITAAFCLCVVPRLFSFVSIQYAWDMVLFVVPYLLACIFFAHTVMSFMREREECMLLVVFTSILLLFIAGVSWPSSNIPVFLRYISCIFPSTFGIKSFIAMNTMGARIDDVWPYVMCLWVQVAVYFGTTLLIYYNDYHKPVKK